MFTPKVHFIILKSIRHVSTTIFKKILLKFDLLNTLLYSRLICHHPFALNIHVTAPTIDNNINHISHLILPVHYWYFRQQWHVCCSRHMTSRINLKHFASVTIEMATSNLLWKILLLNLVSSGCIVAGKLCYLQNQIDGLVQERRNSNALTMELRLSCTNPSKSSVFFS